MIFLEKFSGTPNEIGRAHGIAYRHQIAGNISHFIEHPNELWTQHRKEALEWFSKMRDRHFKTWPWISDEIMGIAQGSGIPYELIEQLNFRIWQYPFYGQIHACSSFVMKLNDSRTVSGGTLDDPRWAYALVEIKPLKGNKFITFPIAGTIWANRGMNEKGLVLNTSALPLPNLKYDPDKIWQQDICFRILLQNCENVQDVTDFCMSYPFSANVLAVDKTGNHVVLSCTSTGVFQHNSELKCITNHLLDDHKHFVISKGWNGRIETPTSESRFVALNSWISRNEGRLSFSNFLHELCRRDTWPSHIIKYPDTAIVMVGLPELNKVLIADLPVSEEKFTEFQL